MRTNWSLQLLLQPWKRILHQKIQWRKQLLQLRLVCVYLNSPIIGHMMKGSRGYGVWKHFTPMSHTPKMFVVENKDRRSALEQMHRNTAPKEFVKCSLFSQMEIFRLAGWVKIRIRLLRWFKSRNWWWPLNKTSFSFACKLLRIHMVEWKQ